MHSNKSNSPTFYITTTTPYVNSTPHIGFALEIITADVIARYHQIIGEETRFNTGTDEHGQKIYSEAQEEGIDTQEYVDRNAETFRALKDKLNLSWTNFIRTTEPHHKAAAQEFWRRCQDNGDIYKKMYKITYCIGCEMEKQASDLEDGKCPLHPTKELEIREEENYFFRFSKYQQALLDLYDSDPSFVQPESKMREIRSFVEGGLHDFSVSRLKEKMPWGVPVPDDEDHVMYVWFDALVNYISTLGWPENESNFERFWPGVQIAGKDNLRQQSAMWQAMLMSSGLPSSRKILINGFISVDGQKMSKSLGNVISPSDLIERYGVDGARFVLMFIGPIGTDMDISWDKFDQIYSAHLANSVGNSCSRVAKLCEKDGVGFDEGVDAWGSDHEQSWQSALDSFDVKKALDVALELAGDIEQQLSEKQPWKQEGDERAQTLREAVASLVLLGKLLAPFTPDVSQKIEKAFRREKVGAIEPLFPRVN